MEDTETQELRYEEIGEIADRILEECEDDAALLAEKLDAMPEPVRNGLISSDFLNAYQIFYFFFRTEPSEIGKEKMILLPASELRYGFLLAEIELLELYFAVAGGEPVIVVSDGEKVLARFGGRDAYRNGLSFIESTL